MELHFSFDQLIELLKPQSPVGNIVLPLIFFAIAIEILLTILKDGSYPWKDSGISFMVLAGHMAFQVVTHGIFYVIYFVVGYQHRLFDIPIDGAHWYWIIILVLLSDLAFYLEHRCSHKINFMWASHSVHHSIEKMVMPAAGRLSWTPLFSGVFLFYLPIVWLGFPPKWVFGILSFSLMYQVFVHTELVPRLGWIELILNTPSSHRVHHAKNTEYIDKNFGGIFIFWDLIFGTYQKELKGIKIEYGLSHPRTKPNNVFHIVYGGIGELIMRLVKAPNWKSRYQIIFAPPQ